MYQARLCQRMNFELFNKPRNLTGVLQVLPGKRDIKRHTPNILYILLNPLIWQHQRMMAKKSLSQIVTYRTTKI